MIANIPNPYARRWSLFMVSALGLFVFSCAQPSEQNEEKGFPLAQIALIQVGQGDAIGLFLGNPNRGGYMVDAGPPATPWDSLIPALGLRRLEALFLTHPDADHIGGVPRLLTAIPINRLYLSSRSLYEGSGLGREILDLAARLGIPVDTLSAGMSLPLEGDYEPGHSYGSGRLEVLWPPPDTLMPGNNGSLVLRFSLGSATALFTGDIGREVESTLLQHHAEKRIDLSSQWLKVAHHGSKTSSHLAFLRKVNPNQAAISCDSSVYGHPHAETLASLEQALPHPENIWRTDRRGTLWFKTPSGMGWSASASRR